MTAVDNDPDDEIGPPAHLWGIDGHLRRLTGGNRNRIWRTAGPGPARVFKSTCRSLDAIQWLVPVHEAARQAGFVVPRMIPSQAGAWVERGWTCEEFIEGDPVTSDDLALVVAQIAQFHLLAAGLPQRPGFLSSTDLLHQMRGGDVSLDEMPPDVVAACRAAWQDVGGGPCTVVHGDLNMGNLIRCSDGRLALIDWDECRRDLALFDTGVLFPPDPTAARAVLAWEVACCWHVEPDRARRLARGL